MVFAMATCIKSLSFCWLVFSSVIGLSNAQDDEGIYKIGVGVSDITGPPAGTVLNGYIGWEVGQGIYTRTFARAFVVESKTSGDAIVYVSCDMGMIDHTIVSEVVDRLQAKYGSKFTQKNVMLSATHTHSGVSGYMTYFAYTLIESKGFNPISFWSAVDGITEAIEAAVDSTIDGKLYWGQGTLENTTRSRATEPYLNNPEWERAMYTSNVDKELTILKLLDTQDVPIGVFTWYPVHPSDFNPSGDVPIVSSDHKGYAAILFDKEMNNPTDRPGKGKFVSGFGSSNLGDVATDHPQCEEPKERIDMTPYIKRARCPAVRQFWKALEIFNDVDNLHLVTGPIRYTHTFLDVDTVEAPSEAGPLRMCQGALGVTYFGELDPEGWLWEIIRDLVRPPSEEMKKCQEPKKVILAGGEMEGPWPWVPSIFSLQLFSIGNISMAGLPGEFTTMSGRRVVRAIEEVTVGNRVILAGLTNNYINYITTPEEYDIQEFEAGATIYGRNTLPVVTHFFGLMAQALADGDPSRIPDGPTPPSFLHLMRDDIRPWVDPKPPTGLDFGSVLVDANETYVRSTDTQVQVTFIAGSPRNFPLRKGTFLVVEKWNEETPGGWMLWRTDADIDTGFFWGGPTVREAVITWFIDESTEEGKYRIRHFGYYRTEAGAASHTYSGASREFTIF